MTEHPFKTSPFLDMYTHSSQPTIPIKPPRRQYAPPILLHLDSDERIHSGTTNNLAELSNGIWS